MKTKCITRLMIIVILYMHPILSHSTIVTVDNNYPSQGDFTTLQAAHDAASNGDTILIFPSFVPYQGLVITKRLIIIGSGFEQENDNVKLSILKSSVSIDAGGDGTVMEGLLFKDFDNYSDPVGLIINANSTLVRRNKLERIFVYPNHTGNIISQNHVEFTGNHYQWGSIYVENGNEVLIENNIVINDNGSVGRGIILYGTAISGSVCNNVIMVYNLDHGSNTTIDLNYSNCEAYNNIAIQGNAFGSNFFNNMGDGTQFPTGNGNMQNVSMNEVFVDHNSYDFHLKPGSPAFGNGLNGDDMGVYGGARPFVDHGYPGIPSIYFLNVPFYTTPQEGLNVTIKAKSNPQ
ncbi:MAG TPA: hypothetical protein PLW31_08650 [Bacteroidales bacterium]|nr:hypothetical protein [Bacteroidales bacterium]HPI85121.1 hypothetical protein [Bacteroidales bacterium]